MPPVGFKRSRALWDNARRPHASRWQAVRPYLRAVLYELQPIRSSQLPPLQDVSRTLRQFWNARVLAAVQGFPTKIRTAYTWTAEHATRRHAMYAVAAVVYYAALRAMHAALDAGPILLIATALVGIFTIGLGDQGNADGISAYSVFNRGFQRLLGTVDAEDLVAQQMGGGLRMPAQQQQQQQQHPRGGDYLEPPPPRRRAAEPEPDILANNDANDDDDDANDDNAEDENNNDSNNNNNRARLSRKKARGRRNLEQRRELRRQREAAQAMGFGGDDEGLALQRLVDEQHMAAAAAAEEGQ